MINRKQKEMLSQTLGTNAAVFAERHNGLVNAPTAETDKIAAGLYAIALALTVYTSVVLGNMDEKLIEVPH